MKPGRKSKYGPEIVSELCKWISEGNTARDACKLVGISEETFYKWKREKPELTEALSAAEAKCKAVCIKRVLDAGDRDWRASAWILERKHKHEYAKKDLLETHNKTVVDIASAVSAAAKMRAHNEEGDIDLF